MKKSLVVLFTLVLLILGLAVAASAEAAPRMKVNVPFAFYFGGQMLPAGEYLIEMPSANMSGATGSMVIVRNEDGSVYHCLHAIVDNHTRAYAWQVTFHKYGGTYFFRKVQNSTFVSTLPKTRAEKELSISTALRLGGGSEDIVAASPSQK